MSVFMKLYMKNDLDLLGNIEALFKYFRFESEVKILDLGKPSEVAVVNKPERFMAAVRILNRFRYIPTELGIEPNVVIDFELDSQWRESRTEIMWDSLDLLRQTTWNSALIHGDASPLFVRRNSKLFLNSRYVDENLWTQERLDWVDMPYTLEELPEI